MDSGFYILDTILDSVFLVHENVESRFQSLARFWASYIEQAPAVKKVDNVIHRINPYPVDSAIGPLQLVIHVVQNRRAGEQK